MKHIFYLPSSQADPEPRRVALENAGYEVTVLEDTKRCLSTAENNPPDMVIADVLLKGMTGFDLCIALRSGGAPTSLPLILCTSVYRGAIYQNEADRIGVQEYMLHPLDMDEFLQKVSKHLGESNSIDSVAA
ncbi:MAG: DNA-binding response OmpR family regulator [Planctomycetota bacterium]|jgi:DNA-binding response OmpR family regulator